MILTFHDIFIGLLNRRSSQEGNKNHQSAMGKLSLEQQFHKLDTNQLICVIFGTTHLIEPGLVAIGRWQIKLW